MMTREEFEKSLINPLAYWNNKSKTQVKALLGKEAARMVQYDQRNPHHCYDLFLQTLHTVRFISDDTPIALRAAAFFHDIGKLYVAQDKNGRRVFYGHTQKSAEIARKLLCKLGYSFSEIDYICFYISYHNDFISWVLPSDRYDHNNPFLIEITEKNVKAHIEEVGRINNPSVDVNSIELWTNILLLCSADISAQADIVYKDGIVIDSKEHKQSKINAINAAIQSAFTP